VLTLFLLVRPTAHAIRWRPMAAGAALGPAVLLVPEALVKRITEAQLTSLTRITAICMALGVAFLLDDPATRSTRTVPTPRLARYLVRVALAGPGIALWWLLTLHLVKTTGHHAAAAHLPVAALTLEAATLLAAALAVSAVAQRRSVDGNTSVVAAPGVLLVVAAAWALPQRVELIVRPADPGWTASHYRWAVLLGLALAAFHWAGHEPVTRTAPRRRG
jgi:fluoroquinolone transport system permease protein